MKDCSRRQDNKGQTPLVTRVHETESEGTNRATNVSANYANPLQADEQASCVGRSHFAHIYGTVCNDHAGADSAKDSSKQKHANVDRSGLERSRNDGDSSSGAVGKFAAKLVGNWSLDNSPYKCSGQESGLNTLAIKL